MVAADWRRAWHWMGPTLMGRVDGKVAIVTGGARGMGASHARLLAAEGAKVLIADVLDDLGDRLVRQIGDSARYVHLDVTEPDQWETAIATATGEFGKLDVFVNNAGIVNGAPIQNFPITVAARHRRQPDGYIPGHPRRGWTDDRRRWRLHHERLVGRRPARQRLVTRVCRVEMGRTWLGQVGCPGTRTRTTFESIRFIRDMSLPRWSRTYPTISGRSHWVGPAPFTKFRRSCCSWPATNRPMQPERNSP